MVPGGNPYPPEDVESGKMLAILGLVISPAWIIPLITRDNAFALYHAKQALVLNIVAVVVTVVLSVIVFVTSFFTCGLSAILYLLLFVLIYPWVMGLVYAVQGKYEPMPWVGQFADQWLGNIQADKRPGSLPQQGGQPGGGQPGGGQPPYGGPPPGGGQPPYGGPPPGGGQPPYGGQQ